MEQVLADHGRDGVLSIDKVQIPTKIRAFFLLKLESGSEFDDRYKPACRVVFERDSESVIAVALVFQMKKEAESLAERERQGLNRGLRRQVVCAKCTYSQCKRRHFLLPSSCHYHLSTMLVSQNLPSDSQNDLKYLWPLCLTFLHDFLLFCLFLTLFFTFCSSYVVVPKII